MPILTPIERRALRAKAHHLNPVVTVGQHGLTPAVLHEIDIALKAHELIKIRVLSDERELREAMLARICAELEAAPVQHLGKLLIVWREAPEPEPAAKPEPKAKPSAKKAPVTKKAPSARKATFAKGETSAPAFETERRRATGPKRESTPNAAAMREPRRTPAAKRAPGAAPAALARRRRAR